jgi:hypothetical protein
MPPEIPIKCDSCGRDDRLIHGLVFGKLNGLLSIGGPGQVPPTMGTQFAMYLCLNCDGIFPYRKHYAAQPQVQAQYEAIMKACRERMDRTKKLEDGIKQIESIQGARKSLSSLPGATGSFESQISSAVAPLKEEIEALKAELMKRRGGRPRKVEEENE